MRRITNNSLRRKELFDNVKPLRDSLNLISIIAIKEMHWMGGFDSYRNEICWTLARSTRSCEGIPQTLHSSLPLQGSKMRISVQIRRWHPTNGKVWLQYCRGKFFSFWLSSNFCLAAADYYPHLMCTFFDLRWKTLHFVSRFKIYQLHYR